MENERWVDAIYAGKKIENMQVSDLGRVRRGSSEPTYGTANIDKKYGRLRSMQGRDGCLVTRLTTSTATPGTGTSPTSGSSPGSRT